jgi:Tat protein translocase TatB subunit
MFNIGGGEIIVIMLIALIVLGPQRLPDAARQIGKTMGDLRRLSTGFQNEMRSALDTADDPDRVAGRRNVLTAPGTTAPAPDDAPVADAVAQVSAQPSAPAKTEPPARAARAAAKKTTARKVPLKAAPAPKKAAAKKTAAKKTAAKTTTGAKKTAVSKAAPRRTKA